MDIKTNKMELISNSTLISILSKFPFLIRFKRYILAYTDDVRHTKETYSQYCEDLSLKELLPILSPEDCIYIEIGANQPTQISNTYLFYRKGFHGIVVEPNREMTSLFRRFRPRDIHLEIGCSDINGFLKFKKSESSVLSGFSDDIKTVINTPTWVPIMTVDQIWCDAGEKKMVFLLSIDTEGYDLNVLRGAKETLKHTIYVIIETSEDDLVEIQKIMMLDGFKLVKKTECNYIYLNEDFFNENFKN